MEAHEIAWTALRVATAAGVYLLAGVAVSGTLIRCVWKSPEDDSIEYRGFLAIIWPAIAGIAAIILPFYVAGRLSLWFFPPGPEE